MKIRILAVSVVLTVVASGVAVATSTGSFLPSSAAESAVPEARCGPGSRPETGMQGQVPLRDRQSGRSLLGYSCNVELLGRYQGQGTTWVSQSFKDCAYHSQAFPSSLTGPLPGVHVVDVRDPRRPRLARTLTSPAFLGNTWESLKVNQPRRLLAGTFVGALYGAGLLDVYDLGTDCRRPRLLNSIGVGELSLPAGAFGHEGEWSPDGRTYWAASNAGGLLTAIDLADPTRPQVVWSGVTGTLNHGMSFSPDGRLMYIAQLGTGSVPSQELEPNGMRVFDVSDVQDRRAKPRPRELGHVFWTDGSAGQHGVTVTYGGRPHVYWVDEGRGAVRLIDVGDPSRPRVVSKLKLEVNLPENYSVGDRDGAGTGTFVYSAHYCAADRAAEPTRLACGFMQSGVRVFDVRSRLAPREVGYYNPPAQKGKNARLVGSEHANGIVGSTGTLAELTADLCSSPPRFVGRDQLWVSCQDNGFLALRLNGRSAPVR